MPTQKTQREERDRDRERTLATERPPPHAGSLALPFICFFPPLGLPYVNWTSQECCLFYLRSSLRSSVLPLFQVSHSGIHFFFFFFYSNYLTGLWNLRIKLTSVYILLHWYPIVDQFPCIPPIKSEELSPCFFPHF